jgi:uncharacterized membrane protein
MPGNKNIIAGISFFVVACLIISFSGFSPMLFPAQEDHAPGQYGFGPLTSSYALKQSFIAQEDYLSGVDLLLVNGNNIKGIDNVMLITDSNFTVLATVKFSSDIILSPGFFPFKFAKRLKVTKGDKCYIVVYSINGDQNNAVGFGMLTSKKFSPITFVPVQNNNILASLKMPGQPYNKSICFRTYESGFESFSAWQIPLYIISLLISFIILFFRKIRKWLLKVKFFPEWVYIPFALAGGIALVFLTPPLQVPDENFHLYRSYQVSELNIFQSDQSIPKSLVLLSDTLKRMNFSLYEKTSPEELKSLTKVKLEPNVRYDIQIPSYFLPYFPQALGIFIGRIFNSSPISLVYFGRILNLLFSVFFVFLAIRAVPFFKWVFLLLGLMPMTMYLFSSLSKDGITISLSFLLIATLLKYAFNKEKKIETTDLILLILLACCVALTRYIYLILLAMYFFIPVAKVGTLKKYLLVFLVLLVSVLLAVQIPKAGTIFKSPGKNATEEVIQTSVPAKVTEKGGVKDQTQAAEGANSKEQIRYILHNPVEYAGIVYKTVFIYLHKLYLDSFVGILGWMTRPVPQWLINMYYLLLILTALMFSEEKIKTGFKNWLVLVCIFIGGIVLVETGQYIGWSGVGQKYIEGVQGRYYIPYAPAFFLLFYNVFIYKHLKMLLGDRKSKPPRQKLKGKVKPVPEVQSETPVIITNIFYIFIICFMVVSVLSTLYTVVSNYYVI